MLGHDAPLTQRGLCQDANGRGYMCVFACVRVCLYANIIYIYTYIYVYTYIYTFIYIYIWMRARFLNSRCKVVLFRENMLGLGFFFKLFERYSLQARSMCRARSLRTRLPCRFVVKKKMRPNLFFIVSLYEPSVQVHYQAITII